MKKAINLIPVGVLLTITVLSFQKWQAVQALKPDYNNPNKVLQGLAPQPGSSQRWEVANVVDGDTLTVRAEGKENRIRLCGIDAPALGQPVGNDAHKKLKIENLTSFKRVGDRDLGKVIGTRYPLDVQDALLQLKDVKGLFGKRLKRL